MNSKKVKNRHGYSGARSQTSADSDKTYSSNTGEWLSVDDSERVERLRRNGEFLRGQPSWYKHGAMEPDKVFQEMKLPTKPWAAALAGGLSTLSSLGDRVFDAISGSSSGAVVATKNNFAQLDHQNAVVQSEGGFSTGANKSSSKTNQVHKKRKKRQSAGKDMSATNLYYIANRQEFDRVRQDVVATNFSRPVTRVTIDSQRLGNQNQNFGFEGFLDEANNGVRDRLKFGDTRPLTIHAFEDDDVDDEIPNMSKLSFSEGGFDVVPGAKRPPVRVRDFGLGSSVPFPGEVNLARGGTSVEIANSQAFSSANFSTVPNIGANSTEKAQFWFGEHDNPVSLSSSGMSVRGVVLPYDKASVQKVENIVTNSSICGLKVLDGMYLVTDLLAGTVERAEDVIDSQPNLDVFLQQLDSMQSSNHLALDRIRFNFQPSNSGGVLSSQGNDLILLYDSSMGGYLIRSFDQSIDDAVQNRICFVLNKDFLTTAQNTVQSTLSSGSGATTNLDPSTVSGVGTSTGFISHGPNASVSVGLGTSPGANVTVSITPGLLPDSSDAGLGTAQIAAIAASVSALAVIASCLAGFFIMHKKNKIRMVCPVRDHSAPSNDIDPQESVRSDTASSVDGDVQIEMHSMRDPVFTRYGLQGKAPVSSSIEQGPNFIAGNRTMGSILRDNLFANVREFDKERESVARRRVGSSTIVEDNHGWDERSVDDGGVLRSEKKSFVAGLKSNEHHGDASRPPSAPKRGFNASASGRLRIGSDSGRGYSSKV